MCVARMTSTGSMQRVWPGTFRSRGRSAARPVAALYHSGTVESTTKTPRPQAIFPPSCIARALPAGPEGSDYYAFDVGALHMLVLDSEHGTARYQSQAAWLAEDLPAHSSQWKMAMCHRPAYSSGTTHGSEPDVDAYLVPAFEADHLDAFFGSHDHIYERTCSVKGGACVTDPSVGTQYFVTGGAGAFMNPIGGGKWFTDEFFAQFHYMLVELAFDTVSIQARDKDGVTLDEIAWSRAVLAQPLAIIQATPNPATVGELVTFDGTGSASCGGTIVGYSWQLGDGGTSLDPAFTHAYAEAGSYDVTLTVTDNDGATADGHATVVVEPAGSDDDTGSDGDDDLATSGGGHGGNHGCGC